MTISAEVNRKTYSCNGVLTNFAFDFLIFAEGDLTVTITDSGGTATVLEITTDYTVAGENGKFESGGTVSTVKEIDGSMQAYAWATGYKITIELGLGIKQETDLVYGGSYSTQDIERMADRLTKICQQLNDAINRSVVLGTASALSGLTIPDLIAGRYLYAADAETLGWAVSVDTTALTVSDWAKTLLDDVNTAAALTTLGLSTYIKTLMDDANAYTARKTLLTPMSRVLAAKTESYIVVGANDGALIPVDATASNIGITLPAVADLWNGFTIGIKKIDSSANYVESIPNGAEKVDGASSHFVRRQNNMVWYVVDGTGWKIASNTEIANSEIIGIMINDSVKDPAVGTAGLRTLGTGAAQAAAGNQQMVPTGGSVTEAKLAADTLAFLYRSHCAAGNVLIQALDTERVQNTTAVIKIKSSSVNRGGTLRIKFSLMCFNPGGGRLAHAQIYRNGAAVGTERTKSDNAYTEYSEDIAGWRPLDFCQLYVWCSIADDQATVKEFRIYSNIEATLD